MEELMVKAEGISKSFGSLEVLHDISFSLTKGNVLSIIGPSGSGKSTLLRIITQEDRASYGSCIPVFQPFSSFLCIKEHHGSSESGFKT